MPSERFDVFFAGKLMQGQDPAQVRERVRQLFKASDAQLKVLFSGQPVALRRGLDMESASRYRLAFRQAGALVEIRPAKAGTDSSSAKAPGPTTWNLLPANSGSLEEYAPAIAPQRLPDISSLGLAAPGTDLDEGMAPTTPAHIETGSLSLVPGADWTLEDCQPAPLPQVMPDLEGLELAAPGSGGALEPERVVRPPPEVSGLSLVETDSEDATTSVSPSD